MRLSAWTGTGDFDLLKPGSKVEIKWYFSADGGALQPTTLITTVSGVTMLAYTVDFSSIAAVAAAKSVTLVGEFSGTAGNLIGLDNIQIIGQKPSSTVGTPPTITGTPLSNVPAKTVYAPFAYTVTGTPTPESSVTVGTLPDGLSLNTKTHTLTGTLTKGGSYTFTVTAANGVPPAASITSTIVVTEPVDIRERAEGPPPDAALDAPYSYRYLVSGFPVPTLSVATGALPTGLTLAQDGTISGTPTVGGTFAGTILAQVPGGASKSVAFSIVVKALPIIIPPADLIGRVNEPFTRTYTVTGVPTPTFAIVEGTLPPGLTLSGTTISGTPTKVGFTTIAVRAQNTSGPTNLGGQKFEIRGPATFTLPTGGGVSFTEKLGADFSFIVEGLPTPTVTVTGAPAWLTATVSLNAPTQGVTTVRLTGTPPEGSSGAYPLTLRAENGEAPTTTTLTVNVVAVTEPPVITLQPVGRALLKGQALTLTVAATGVPAPNFQWRRNQVNLPGATTATFSVASVTVDDAGSYDVVVANAAGTVTSTAAVVTVREPVVITTQPVDVGAGLDQPFDLTVVAEGSPPLSYQWRFQGLPIAGATSATFTVAKAAAANAGTYDVIVSNAVGPKTSDIVTVTVEGAPKILTQPVGATVALEAPISLFVTGQSLAPLTFQWTLDGENIPGATGRVLEVAAAALTDAGTYTVSVLNKWGATVSVPVEVVVVEKPVIETGPESRIVARGTPTTFTVALVDDAEATFQWLRDGEAIAGATGATYTLTSAQPADALATFTVRATTLAGSVVSEAASLIVFDPASVAFDAPGGKRVAQVSAPEGVFWSASSDNDWLTLKTVTPAEDAPYVEFTAKPLPEGGERTGAIAFEAEGFASGVLEVRQGETVAAIPVFNSWTVPGGGSVNASTAGGRGGVLTLGGIIPPANALSLAPGIALAVQQSARVVSPARLPIGASVRVEEDVYLAVPDANGNEAVASVGLSDSTDATQDRGARLALWHAGGAAAGRLAGHTWIRASYRDDAGVLRELSLAAALPVDDLRNKWVRLRIEVSDARAVSFWVDAEPFGDPVRVWNPATVARADVLDDPFVVLGLAGSGAGNQPYLDKPTVVSGIVARPGRSQVVNLSTRTHVGAGERTAIAGLKMSGTGFSSLPKLLFRAVGPGLSEFNVSGLLADPKMVIYVDGPENPPAILRVQGTWEQQRFADILAQIGELQTSLGAFPLKPGSKDSAWVFAPGGAAQRPGTVHVTSLGGSSTGTALLEVYRDTSLPGDELLNLSTRAYVPAGTDMIAGFVLEGTASRVLLVRGIGPALTAFAIANPLAKPVLRLFRKTETLLSNAGWSAAETAAVIPTAATVTGAFALANGSADSAVLVRVPPGIYTAVIQGSAATEAGVALVEVYALPETTDIDSAPAP